MTYKVQIDDTIREATAEEIAVIESEATKAAMAKQKAADELALKTSARTKLKALGLTDDEIAALIP